VLKSGLKKAVFRVKASREKQTCPCFGDTKILIQYSVRYAEEGLCAEIQLDAFSRFDTIAECDGQTDGQTPCIAYTALCICLRVAYQGLF